MANFSFFLLYQIFVLLLLCFSSKSNSISDQLQESPITRFQNYLRINTAHPNPNYTTPINFLTSIANPLNLKSQILQFVPNKPILLLTWQGSNPSLPSILFNSHLDSVPVEPPHWAHPPFAAVRNPAGKIYARGAQDDKCIAIQQLEAIRNLKAKNFTPNRTVRIAFVPDEEIGGADGAAKFVNSREFGDLNVGFVMDEGIASESGEFRVFNGDRTPWNLVIRANGRPGHGSKLYDNGAMENLMKSVEVITRFRENQFDAVKAGKALDSEVVSVNPVYVKAGIPSPTGFVMNMQPSEAEAGFNVRLTPTTDPDLFRRKIADEWAPAARNMTFEIIELGPLRDNKGRPLITPADNSNPWWLVFKQAIAAAGGKLAKPEILISTTDARYYRQLGIPAFGFSPMINTPPLSHQHNEYLEESVFLKGIEVYEHIMTAFSSFVEVK